MTGDKTSTSFQRGLKAALAGKPKSDNPFDPGYFRNQYDRGHDKGTKELARKASKKGKLKWL